MSNWEVLERLTAPLTVSAEIDPNNDPLYDAIVRGDSPAALSLISRGIRSQRDVVFQAIARQLIPVATELIRRSYTISRAAFEIAVSSGNHTLAREMRTRGFIITSDFIDRAIEARRPDSVLFLTQLGGAISANARKFSVKRHNNRGRNCAIANYLTQYISAAAIYNRTAGQIASQKVIFE